MRGISNAGSGEVFGTFKTSLTKSDVGKAVVITANDTVGLGVDGNEVAGKLIRVEDDGVALVQVGGYMELDYAAAPSLNGKVVVNGAGKVKVPAAGTGRGLVTKVDNTNLKAGLFL